MHIAEHKVSPAIYQASHKPHHKWRVPRLFDAFNGSTADTVLMILLPLYVTANVIHCNVWSYMAFGTIYANYLTLIHRCDRLGCLSCLHLQPPSHTRTYPTHRRTRMHMQQTHLVHRTAHICKHTHIYTHKAH